MNYFIYILILAMLVEAITEFIVKASILEPLRQRLEENKQNRIISFINDLVSCGYCTSVWISFFLSSFLYLFCNFQILIDISNNYVFNLLINFILSVILTHRVSNYLHGFSDRYFDTRKDNRYK